MLDHQQAAVTMRVNTQPPLIQSALQQSYASQTARRTMPIPHRCLYMVHVNPTEPSRYSCRAALTAHAAAGMQAPASFSAATEVAGCSKRISTQCYSLQSSALLVALPHMRLH
jgi:hypothetical protein